VRRGGTKEDDNLVTLCDYCHTAAHNGSKTTTDVVYDGRDAFEDWLSTDPDPSDAKMGQTTLADFGDWGNSERNST